MRRRKRERDRDRAEAEEALRPASVLEGAAQPGSHFPGTGKPFPGPESHFPGAEDAGGRPSALEAASAGVPKLVLATAAPATDVDADAAAAAAGLVVAATHRCAEPRAEEVMNCFINNIIKFQSAKDVSWCTG